MAIVLPAGFRGNNTHTDAQTHTQTFRLITLPCCPLIICSCRRGTLDLTVQTNLTSCSRTLSLCSLTSVHSWSSSSYCLSVSVAQIILHYSKPISRPLNCNVHIAMFWASYQKKKWCAFSRILWEVLFYWFYLMIMKTQSNIFFSLMSSIIKQIIQTITEGKETSN